MDLVYEGDQHGWICQECGVLARDTDLHTFWHQDLGFERRTPPVVTRTGLMVRVVSSPELLKHVEGCQSTAWPHAYCLVP